MSAIVHNMARKRRTATFFGTECQLADLSHSAIEIKRVEDENAMLRAEIADLKRSLSESIQGQHATALRLAELMERESALVSAIELSESAHRYTLETLRMAQRSVATLQENLTVRSVAARSTRTLAAISEIDSE